MGIDLGGTSTRAELVDGTGEVLGIGVCEGANLRSAGNGIPGAAQAVRRAAERALAEAGAARALNERVRDAERGWSCEGTPEAKGALAEAGGDGAVTGAGSRQPLPEVVVVAASGAGAARHQEVTSAFQEALAGICDRVHVENDLAAAFRSASSGGDGYLLLSGTGAVAGRYRNGLLERRADGLGWILGDTGSGLWIGWQGLRAAAADLDGRGPRTELTALIAESLEVPAITGDPCQDLVRRVDELAPAQMGGLAPLVLASATTDEVAAGIAGVAARALLTSLDAVVAGWADRELVLAGGVLAHPTPVRETVVAELETRGGWRVVTAADPVVGAVRIAQDLVD